MKPGLLALGFLVLGVAFAVPGGVGAQTLPDSDKLHFLEHCAVNPDEVECICAPAARLRIMPKGSIDYLSDPPTAAPHNSGGTPPVYDDGLWIPQPPAAPDMDEVEVVEDEHFTRNCALSFFREDLNRGWRIAVAVAAGFLSLSLVWGGFTYMQEAASGGDLARARARVLRVLIGIIIVAMAVVIWEGLADFLAGSLDSWTSDPYRFYDYRYGG